MSLWGSRKIAYSTVLIAYLLPSWRGFAQEAEDRPPRSNPLPAEVDPNSQSPDEGLPPLELERSFEFPDPNRPWGQPRYLDPDRLGGRTYPRTYSGRRRYYYDDYTHRFGVPYRNDPESDDLERAYRQGVEDGRNFERFDNQAQRGLTTYQRSMAEGHAAFSAGRYGDAARAFLLAARVNQGDAASRLCAAHGHIAVGLYGPAAGLIRRALDLQPKIAYLPMDLRTAYGNQADFLEHLEALSRAWEANPNDPNLCLVLGYCYFYSKQPKKARVVLSRAMELQPDDNVIRSLHEAAMLSNSPRERENLEIKTGRSRHDL